MQRFKTSAHQSLHWKNGANISLIALAFPRVNEKSCIIIVMATMPTTLQRPWLSQRTLCILIFEIFTTNSISNLVKNCYRCCIINDFSNDACPFYASNAYAYCRHNLISDFLEGNTCTTRLRRFVITQNDAAPKLVCTLVRVIPVLLSPKMTLLQNR